METPDPLVCGDEECHGIGKLSIVGTKPDLYLWLRVIVEHPADRVEHDREVFVVLFFHRLDLATQIVIFREHGAKFGEGTDDLDVHRDGARALQDAGEHGDALLGERVRLPSDSAASDV